jgi:hypothetical protein
MPNYGLLFEINENLFEDSGIVYDILWSNFILECYLWSLSVFFYDFLHYDITF